MKLSHNPLLRSLAAHLRDPERIQFLEPNLNGWAMGGEYGSPDLLEITKSYSRFVRRVFEVKASQADLLSDLRAEKWTRYLPICDRLTFAVQDGVDYEKYLRPLPVGILVYRNGKWRTVRAAPPNQKAEPWHDHIWMALLFGRMGARQDSRLARLEAEALRLRSAELEELRYSAHQKLASKAADLHRLEKDLQRRQSELEARDHAAEADIRERVVTRLCKIMGTYVWGPVTEEEILTRWARETLNRAWQETSAKLLAFDQEARP